MPRTLLFALAILPALPCPAQDKAVPLWPRGAAPYHDASIDSDRPKLIAYPADPDQRNGAAVVVCPGGGYGGLAADHEGHQIAQFFNDHGVSAYVLHYRLGSKGYHYPAQLADVLRALRTVRNRAVEGEHDIDPERIGVIGFSAGGHLASMAATLFDREAYPADADDPIDQHSARPDFAVLGYPVISMEDGVTHAGSRRNLSGLDDPRSEPAKIRSLSSEHNVSKRTPPTFIFHTSEDTVVPVENALRFYQALVKNDVPAELHIYQSGPHGIGLFRNDPAAGTWSAHLITWLRDNGLFATDSERAAVAGEVTLDGRPVSWGSIRFQPVNENLPVTVLRVRSGKFTADAGRGPVIAPSTVHFEATIWEQTQNPDDRVILTDRLSPRDATALVIDDWAAASSTDADNSPRALRFDLESR